MRLVLTGVVLAACGLLTAASCPRADASDARAAHGVQLHLQADRISYSVDRTRAVLEGNVRVRAWAPGHGPGEAVLTASRVEVDRSLITARDGANFILGPVTVSGDDLWFDASRQEFRLADPTGQFRLSGPGRDAIVYFSGAEIAGAQETAHIAGGRITTCDRDRPHYVLTARRVTFHPDSGDLTVQRAAVRLYGVTIPLVPSFRTSLGRDHSSLTVPVPGYSDPEGVYLPYSLRLSGQGSPVDAVAAVRLTQKRGITGTVWAEREWGRMEAQLRASRREWVLDNVTDQVSLDRLPELNLAYHVTDRDDPGAAVSLRFSVGDLQEETVSGARGDEEHPRVRERRAMGAVTYAGNPLQQRARHGTWYGAEASLGSYSSGDTYRNLEVYAGLGGHVSPSVAGYATLRHNASGGASPFLSDRADIRSELEAGLDLLPGWDLGLHGWGRYDLESRELRDHELGLSYQAHCLTWRLYYRDLGSRIGLRVDLTGLSADSRRRPARSPDDNAARGAPGAEGASGGEETPPGGQDKEM